MLRDWPAIATNFDDVELLFERAEYHGLAGVLNDSIGNSGASISSKYRMRDLARQIDHTAHLEALRAIDRAFANAELRAAVLKGVLFAERFYPRPSARVASDTDLLVREVDLAAATAVLEKIGYIAAVGHEEKRFRREHHHLHFRHPCALPLELHFHAYKGFGRTLYSEPLLERSVEFRDFRALRVLASDDELVYLATHAAAHQFGRWSWLFDMRLLIEKVEPETLHLAGERARALGFACPLALAARLLVSIMRMDAARLAPLGELGGVHGAVMERLLHPPSNPFVRAASRLIYTTALCADARTSVQWVARELIRRGRGLVVRDE